jgi:hypothetical protein
LEEGIESHRLIHPGKRMKVCVMQIISVHIHQQDHGKKAEESEFKTEKRRHLTILQIPPFLSQLFQKHGHYFVFHIYDKIVLWAFEQSPDIYA